jgi:hypothetical protein
VSVRAVCLDATDDRLVLQATPTEVSRFGRGDELQVTTMRDAMDLLARQGWRPEPLPDYQRGMYWQDAMHLMGTGRRITARLRTRCGCTRFLNVEWPPPNTVRIPIHDRLSLRAFKDYGPDAADAITHIREFEFSRRMGEHEGQPVAEYEESGRY